MKIVGLSLVSIESIVNFQTIWVDIMNNHSNAWLMNEMRGTWNYETFYKRAAFSLRTI